jgi:DNA/RNA endonuclease YhcR with UshA esterase domain
MRRKVILSMFSAVVAIAVMAATLFAVVGPWVQTDDWNYVPGEVATITGGGFAAGQVKLQVVHVQPDGTGEFTEIAPFHDPWFADVNASGGFETTWNVPEDAAGKYMLLKASQESSGLHAEYSFLDAGNPSADLDQCANDPLPSPSTNGCSTTAAEWVNGNLGASKSSYFEGDSIPYRLKFDNLSLTSHTVVIEWDTTKSSKHAIDYLTTFNRTVATANPCLGVSGCNAGTFSTFGIPADPQVTGAGVTPVAGVFQVYGGTITAVSAFSYSNGTGFAGDKSASIAITFTATTANPVLAWGGHIATRQDWGANNSAVAISGSPYHTRLLGLDGSGGNQDRSLSADAVIFPGSITIIKAASPEGPTSFSFTALPTPLSNFNLVDDGTSANTKLFSNITNFQTYTITEGSAPSGWTFASVSCTVTSANGGSSSTNGAIATINMNEGENYTCTYVNNQQPGTLIVIKHVINDNGGTATAPSFTMTVAGTGVQNGTTSFAGAESPGTSLSSTLIVGGGYNVTETGPSGYAASFSADCTGTIAAGVTKTCTVTNDDNAATLIINKVVVNDNGGTLTEAAFSGTFTGVTSAAGQTWAGASTTRTLTSVGSYNVLEPDTAGYTKSFSTDCTGTIALGETKTCTVTNNDNGATLIINKVVVNDNGGTLTAADFSGTFTGVTSAAGQTWAGASTTRTLTSVGSYNVLEPDTAGYTKSFSTDCTGTIALGQTKTCTVTNDDNAATLIINKVVVNDNGGTLTAAAFSGTFTGVTSAAGQTWAGASTTRTLTSVGSYNVLEPDTAGYTKSFSTDCTGTIALGQTKTCTVTNDDNAAHLIINKVVVNDNGGTLTAAAFSGTFTGVTSAAGQTWAGASTNRTLTSVGAYNVLEPDTAGYTKSFSADCTGTIALGETKTCTVTNDDNAAHLIINKVVVNDNGGTLTEAAFSGTFTGVTSAAGQTWAGASTNRTLTSVGSYNVLEPDTPGYAKSFSADCTGTIALGETKTCTVTNNDIGATLIINKVVINDNGGTLTAAAFSGTFTGVTSAAGQTWAGASTTRTLTSVGSYNVLEPDTPGYTKSFSAYCSGTIALGQTRTCTVTNNDIQPTLRLVKYVVNDNGGSKQVSDFPLFVNGNLPVTSGVATA